MSKNPFVNGLAASAYIVLVASVMNFGIKVAPHANSFMVPVAVISVFTLSAAVMGYLSVFFYKQWPYLPA